MTPSDDIDKRADALRALMLKHLGIRGRDLERAVAKAGRLLPTRVRSEAEIIIEAQRLGQNPRLQMRLDSARLDAAFKAVSAHLEAIDLADRRRGQLLSLAGAVAFNLLLVAGLFILWLWWLDYI